VAEHTLVVAGAEHIMAAQQEAAVQEVVELVLIAPLLQPMELQTLGEEVAADRKQLLGLQAHPALEAPALSSSK
jgi:hypothetical protein